MLHDLAVKAAADAMGAMKRTTTLVAPELESSLMALTLQYLAGTFAAYVKMEPATFESWLQEIARCKRLTESAP